MSVSNSLCVQILSACEATANTISFIDEVHAVGLYGNEGGGICQQLGMDERVDVLTGTLGKAYGTLGGYVALSTELRDKVEANMLEYQHDSFLPIPMLTAAKSSVQHLRSSQIERERHQANAGYFMQACKDANFNVIPSESHITPLLVGDAVKCSLASKALLEEHGIYVQPINYPTVPVGTERLRCTPGPMHTKQMMDKMIASLQQVYQELDIPMEPCQDHICSAQPSVQKLKETAPSANVTKCKQAQVGTRKYFTMGSHADYDPRSFVVSLTCPQIGNNVQLVY